MRTPKAFSIPRRATAVNTQLFNAMLAAGRGDQDNSAIISVLEDLAQIQLATKNE